MQENGWEVRIKVGSVRVRSQPTEEKLKNSNLVSEVYIFEIYIFAPLPIPKCNFSPD